MFRFFNHYIPKSFVLLGLTEAVALFLAIYLGTEIRFMDEGWLPAGFSSHLVSSAAVFSGVMVLCMTAMGLYQRRLREGDAGMLVRVVASFLLGLVAMSLVFYMFPDLFLGRGVFAYSLLIGITTILSLRVLFFSLVNKELLKRRVLVLGTGRNASAITSLRRNVDRRGITIAGFVPVEGEEDLVPQDQIVRVSIPLFDYALEHKIDEIVVALDDRRNTLPVQEILECRMSGVEVVDVATFFERETCRLKLDIMQPSWLIFSAGFKSGIMRDVSKRLFDVVASLLLLALTWPLMLFAALAVLVGGGKGPILYRQVRVGQNWKRFHVLKFRSMREDAEGDGVARWAQKDDNRITRVGSILRKLRFDELPQIINVLRGDMSFVGPRPERPEFVETLAETIPYYSERHRVKPGITGWAQVCYPYGSSERDAFEKLQYDLFYVKNYNLFLDLMILLQTTEVIFWRKGAQ